MACPNSDAVKRVNDAQRICSDEMASQMLDEALQPFARDLVCVYETQTVGDALQTLATWGVLGAPVVKGQPPWLSKRHARIDIADWPFDEAGDGNPRMVDVLGFVSVGAIVTALVAETRAIADTDVDGIHDACVDLFAAQVSEVFGAPPFLGLHYKSTFSHSRAFRRPRRTWPRLGSPWRDKR
jgi:CBS domain-containing protein